MKRLLFAFFAVMALSVSSRASLINPPVLLCSKDNENLDRADLTSKMNAECDLYKPFSVFPVVSNNGVAYKFAFCCLKK